MFPIFLPNFGGVGDTRLGGSIHHVLLVILVLRPIRSGEAMKKTLTKLELLMDKERRGRCQLYE